MIDASIPLYHIPPVTRFQLSFAGRFTVLHIVTDEAWDSVARVQTEYEQERETLDVELSLIHVLVSPNPLAASINLADTQSAARVYWYGPDDSDCPVISNKAISEFPYFLVYEQEALVMATSEFEGFGKVVMEIEHRKLKGLAEAATNVRRADISSEVVVSSVLHDLLLSLVFPSQPAAASPPSPPPLPRDAEELLEQQKDLIEKLKFQVSVREKEVEELRVYAVTNPAYQAVINRRKQEAQMVTMPTHVPVVPPEVADFWNEEPEDDPYTNPSAYQLSEIAGGGRGLWILSAETEIHASPRPLPQLYASNAFSTSSKQASVDRVPGAKSPVETKASSFWEQKQKHLAKLMEKQPLGRDGKRLPMPKLSASRASHEMRSTPNIKKASFRKNALTSSSNTLNPFLSTPHLR